MPSQFIDPETADWQDKQIEEFFDVLRDAAAAERQAAKTEPKRYPVVEPEPAPDEELNIHEPWQQLLDEPDDAYEAFFFFRSLWPGMRTQRAAYIQMMRAYDPNGVQTPELRSKLRAPKEWKRWRKKYRWDERAQAWDVNVRRNLIDAEQEQEDLREMVERHMSALRMLQRKGIKHIDEWGFDTAAAALRAVHHSMDMEEKLAGIPDVTHLVTMDGDQLIARYQSLMGTLAGAEEAQADDTPEGTEDGQIPQPVLEQQGFPAPRSPGSGGASGKASEAT